jgi:hypothetical protein
VQELKWDCQLLKRHLGDQSYRGRLDAIITEIVEFSEHPGKDYPDRFFEVEIVKPRRIGKDFLLNETVIAKYLSQVAPVPLNPNFRFSHDVRRCMAEAGFDLAEYDIRLNDAEEPLYRPFCGPIQYSDTKFGEYQEIESFSVPGIDGEPAAVGWLLHHDYQGALPENLGLRGLRARVGNIQVGDERVFVDHGIFPETRFNSWTIGEVHVVDPKILPNGRRDAFEHNGRLANLVNHLVPIGSNIARQCRSSSQIRNRIKEFELGAIKIEETLQILEQGAISKSRARSMRQEVGHKLLEIQNAASFDLLYEELQKDLIEKARNLEARTQKLSSPRNEEGPLAKLPKSKQSIYLEIFDLIYDCSVNRVAAKSLVDKIVARIRHN